MLEGKLIQQQAGIRPGKSCTGQLLNLTQHIEDGFQHGLKTGTVFVDLSAAFDTVNHRILLQKLHQFTNGDTSLTMLVKALLTNSRFPVEINGHKSRWRNQKNGVPQVSILAPVLFNIYTNDQPITADTRSFIYADDLAIITQAHTFEKLENKLEEALVNMVFLLHCQPHKSKSIQNTNVFSTCTRERQRHSSKPRGSMKTSSMPTT